MKFSDLGLSLKVISSIVDSGYVNPTLIQEKAIPLILQGHDVLGLAQTGTGKTASFVLPMLTILEESRARARMPLALILEPTRELAAQVADSFEKYGKNHKLNVALLIGGVSFEEQNRKLERGVDVLICTPGRMLDHFERGKLLMSGIKILVIDEADRMLDMGFIPDIENIVRIISSTRQTLLFSATMSLELQKISKNFLRNPKTIEVNPSSSAAKTVKHWFVAAHSESYQKRVVLRKLIRSQDDLKNAIIFCNQKKDVTSLFRSLNHHGFSVCAIHGDMNQRMRMKILDNFKEGTIQLMVASDIAARGLDIHDVGHVFNFDVPIHAEDYIHRIGRTGRAGRHGKAFTLVTHKDIKYSDVIEKLINEKIEWLNGDLSTLIMPSDSEKNTPKNIFSKKKNNIHESSQKNHLENSKIEASNVQNISSRKKYKNENKQKSDIFYQKNEDTPLGFGSDIPAFMLIVPKN
ncbi:ATP-dependent RNA helicase [Liberibacter crescens BT-1]|uniref:DEAD-box ATP-dependent RNA helicase RhpA n=1 Tax=Liberibacter crescens (strain BT-1) TaxID=1215343 RepID=L0ES89_LIBCB|nr:DEAD/DEAH box helicase [Liberibacter crescens]AGA64369.1 ATP-dependent RNA helicase [Liberibacter crescens BT-1]AMC12561.1 RNA helicase [Liberibacter crescens]